ncbi:MAG: dicarboxylate/amino acid:cation symporter [Gammaproteobacteria bacterium]|nr:dicarboxylate/amino acid:cation symporter [Gammaproteobacteria bacterium]
MSRANYFHRLIAKWRKAPLFQQILIALILGIVTGFAAGSSATLLALPGKLVLQLLGALAPALILTAIIHALMTAQLGDGVSFKIVRLLIMNTLVAISIGLLIANLLQPGLASSLTPPAAQAENTAGNNNPLALFLENIPKSLLGPLGDDGKVIGVIFIAVAFGLALRKERSRPLQHVQDWVELALACFIRILHWIIAVVPLAVFGIVASIIGSQGFSAFKSLGWFVASVLLALALQAAYYLIRIQLCSWVNPVTLLKDTRDALFMAFSTGSSTATMPLTYECLKKTGLREQSASLGALVGANFNNDGTALYEAMAALFIAQMLGMNLGLEHQLMVVLTSVIASVGAAGIPEAGLVTMTLVFGAVGLPTQYIAILLTVDWFLDRCRTAINVMGDINVSCLLDGKIPDSANT